MYPRYVGLVSTTVETNNPEAELAPGLALLGPIKEKLVSVSDVMVPIDSEVTDNVSSKHLRVQFFQVV